MLLQAFHQGAKVILDELNLDKNIELLLGQLLTGVNATGKKADKPGFMVLSTQNPASFAGRKTSSRALRNRLQEFILFDYTDKELRDICQFMRIDNPKAFVASYREAKHQSPDTVNLRTFFEGAQSQVPQAKNQSTFFDAAHSQLPQLAPASESHNNQAVSY